MIKVTHDLKLLCGEIHVHRRVTAASLPDSKFRKARATAEQLDRALFLASRRVLFSSAYRGTDDGEIEPVSSTDIAVMDRADMQRDDDVERRLAVQRWMIGKAGDGGDRVLGRGDGGPVIIVFALLHGAGNGMITIAKGTIDNPTASEREPSPTVRAG